MPFYKQWEIIYFITAVVKTQEQSVGQSKVPDDLIPDEMAINTSLTDFWYFSLH